MFSLPVEMQSVKCAPAWPPADPPSRSRLYDCQRALRSFLTATTALTALMALQCPALAGPTGGTVVQGSAGISQAGSVTNINQSSNRAIINWLGFSIGAGETVNFNQPSSMAATLNRVIGNETSVISGALNANGQVFIVNSAGVLFSKGAQVNVGGLVASTLDISNQNFMAGNYTFSGTSAASVVNQGRIHASPGGYVALLGKTVANDGVITATLGTVAMASGNKITLNFDGNSLVDVTIDEGTLNALVENKRAIRADGGRVILTAKAADQVLSAQVNNSGVIEARTMAALTGGSGKQRAAKTGSIKLLADGGTVNVAGKLDASAPKGGNGGTIETSGDKVKVADSAIITTKAASGQNGTWTVDPDGFTIGTGGDISAATLDSELALGNVTLSSTSGSGTDGNINVNAAVSWVASTTLTLNATNNININQSINAANGGLTLVAGTVTGQINALAAVNVGTFILGGGTWSQIGTLPGFSAHDFRIAGGTFIRALGGQGTSANPYQIADVYGLQGIGSTALLGSSFVLANDIDASGTATWNSNGAATPVYAGFKPIGSPTAMFSGVFDGGDHVITGLSITDTISSDNVGLFGVAGPTGTIGNIGLVGVTITGVGNGAFVGVGALVGRNDGKIINSYATNVTVSGTGTVGGLVGSNSGTITDSYATGSVTKGAGTGQVGGLVGLNTGSISNSYADGNVVATDSSDVGGLVGNNNGGTVINSHATVDVTVTSNAPLSDAAIGGLVGSNNASASITGSYATGNVLVIGSGAVTNVGGLVGDNNHGSISNSSAAGKFVTAANGRNVGGLAGANEGVASISSSSASAAVSGFADVGGLVGLNSGSTITGSQASGAVTATGPNGNGNAGGLVGENGNTSNFLTGVVSVGFIAGSSASGKVTGAAGAEVGGLVGYNNGGTIANSTAGGNVFVTGTDTSGYAGGLVGDNFGGIITNSTSTGDVSGAGTLGGLAGLNTGSIDGSTATGQVNGGTGTLVGTDTFTNRFTHKTIHGTETNSTYHDVKAEAAAAAAAAARTAAALVATRAAAARTADAIATTDVETSAATPPTSNMSAAGTQATAAVAPAQVEDNFKTIEDNINVEEQRERRRAAATKTARQGRAGGKGAGFGATIRSIEINGQRFELQKDDSKKSAPGQ
jgi:filamentous hemagglutinin family protein